MSDGEQHYLALAAKVDAFFARVRERYPGALRCDLGCSACCHQHLTVVSSEFRRVAAAALVLPEVARDALRARLDAGRDDPRCPLLDDAGACRVYAARPLICRSHGVPVAVPAGPEGEATRRDVCPENFSAGPALDDLDADCVLDVSHLDRVLGVIDHLAGGDGGRVDLFDGLRALLAPQHAG